MKTIYYSSIFLISTLLFLPQQALAQYNLIQKGQDIDGLNNHGGTGYSVTMPDSNTIAIGAPWNTGRFPFVPTIPSPGYARILQWDGTSWIQKGAVLSGDSVYDVFGLSVCMPDPNTVAVGAFAPFYLVRKRYVRVYKWNGTGWMQRGLDIQCDSLPDGYGGCISMPDSNTIAVGMPFSDNNGSQSGQVRIYQWSGSAWVQKGMDITGDTTYNKLGFTISMPDQNTVAIGAPAGNYNNPLIGYARVYNWDGSSWVQKGADLLGDTVNDGFGYSISMPDANTVAIGIPRGVYLNDFMGYPEGRVRIFNWNGSSWIQQVTIHSDTILFSFGQSVTMPDANTIGVGAPGDDFFKDSFVRVYKRNGTSWLLKSEVLSNISFGFAVSMPDTSTVGIGRPGFDFWGDFPNGEARVFSIANTIGITEQKIGNIKVYPNPSYGGFTIELSNSAFYENTKIVFYDLLGNELLARMPGRVGTSYTMDVGHLSAGIYVVQVLQDHTIVITERLVINK